MTREEEIAYIKENVKIKDLLDQIGVRYKKHGKYLRAYSLTKEERHPDLVIDTEKNCFWDNPAGVSGSVIDFYMYAFNKDYIEAIRELRTLAGLDNNRKVKIELKRKKFNDFNMAKEEFEKLMGIVMQIKNKTKHLKEIREFINKKINEIEREIQEENDFVTAE